MARQTFLMPKMGESITEATILSWAKSVGDSIEEDETLLEIATDKVDSDIPSPYTGQVLEILYKEGDVVPVDTPIAVIQTDAAYVEPVAPSSVQIEDLPAAATTKRITKTVSEPLTPLHTSTIPSGGSVVLEPAIRPSNTKRFYSPLVRSIAELEQLNIEELDRIPGSGTDGRVTKSDITDYVARRAQKIDSRQINYKSPIAKGSPSITGEVEIVEMDRMRKMIADHMVRSKQTSPHVTSFLEIDVTDIVDWRDRIKENFYRDQGTKITYTPIFLEAVARAIIDFPRINVSVDGDRVIIKKYIHLGMATATDSGNLIVPVIKNADQYDLIGLSHTVNDLAQRARSGDLKPDEVQDGTFTLTNVGTFGNTMGTPIINQPQVAILSAGAIRKKPAVVERDGKDVIEARKFMFLSLSYDHRVVDGALGGQFLRRVGDYLEGFDTHRVV